MFTFVVERLPILVSSGMYNTNTLDLLSLILVGQSHGSQEGFKPGFKGEIGKLNCKIGGNLH